VWCFELDTIAVPAVGVIVIKTLFIQLLPGISHYVMTLAKLITHPDTPVSVTQLYNVILVMCNRRLTETTEAIKR